MFGRKTQELVVQGDVADYATLAMNPELSVVNFDDVKQRFFISLDKILFTDLGDHLETVLSAHGYVVNIENLLACLDSFRFVAYANVNDRSGVKDYIPCISFKLPSKDTIGKFLSGYYAHLSNIQPETVKKAKQETVAAGNVQMDENELTRLKKENADLTEQVKALSLQLSQEQRSFSKVSRALEAQRVLPGETKLGRVERVDLRKRQIIVKVGRKTFEFPTQNLTKIPMVDASCIVLLDDDQKKLVDILFTEQAGMPGVEYCLARVVNVDGKFLKIKDSLRRSFNLRAENPDEESIFGALRRHDSLIVGVCRNFLYRFEKIEVRTWNLIEMMIEQEIMLAYPNQGEN